MLLDIEDLQVSIAGTRILHDVHLGVGAGEIHALVGPNGAGKSTTIAAALGLLNRDAGRIAVFGKDPVREARAIHQRVGVLPEQNGCYDWMTAQDYLAYFVRLYGREPSLLEIARRLRAVGLDTRSSKHIGAYSRGMRQRLGLARALVPNPDLLILDEPTNGLDPRGRREMHDIFKQLAARGTGILLCTHLLDDVERLCSRVSFIVAGRTVADGKIGDLMRAGDRLPRFRLLLTGAPPRNGELPADITVVAQDGQAIVVDLAPTMDADKAWRQLMFLGWPITEIRREGGGLEDLYLDLTQRRAA